jgi:hypothetical protein
MAQKSAVEGRKSLLQDCLENRLSLADNLRETTLPGHFAYRQGYFKLSFAPTKTPKKLLLEDKVQNSGLLLSDSEPCLPENGQNASAKANMQTHIDLRDKDLEARNEGYLSSAFDRFPTEIESVDLGNNVFWRKPENLHFILGKILAKAPSLKKLDLSACKLAFLCLPESEGQLSEQYKFRKEHADLIMIFNRLATFGSLTTLDLSNNHLGQFACLPKCIGALSGLEYLDLSRNGIHSKTLKAICSALPPGLIALNIAHNNPFAGFLGNYKDEFGNEVDALAFHERELLPLRHLFPKSLKYIFLDDNKAITLTSEAKTLPLAKGSSGFLKAIGLHAHKGAAVAGAEESGLPQLTYKETSDKDCTIS